MNNGVVENDSKRSKDTQISLHSLLKKSLRVNGLRLPKRIKSDSASRSSIRSVPSSILFREDILRYRSQMWKQHELLEAWESQQEGALNTQMNKSDRCIQVELDEDSPVKNISSNMSSPPLVCNTRGAVQRCYSCKLCNYETDRLTNLTRHTMAQHSSLMIPENCCDLTFNTRSDLMRHKNIEHTGAYFCQSESCQPKTSFWSKGELKRHKRAVHGTVFSVKDDIFHCTHCSYSTDILTEYDDHVRVVHNEPIMATVSKQNCALEDEMEYGRLDLIDPNLNVFKDELTFTDDETTVFNGGNTSEAADLDDTFVIKEEFENVVADKDEDYL